MNEVDLGTGALWGIAAASISVAVLALLAVRWWCDQEALARSKSQAQAHLLEIRLFRDDPVQAFRSQRALVAANVRWLRLLLVPLAVSAGPVLLVMWQLDALYGKAPLRVGQPAVVSAPARVTGPIQTPAGIAVETPAVHLDALQETVWRIRPRRAYNGVLEVDGQRIRAVAGDGWAYLPEPPLGRRRVRIEYPRAVILGASWPVWFFVLSGAATLFLRRPLRVML
jgi:hypothetical protein